MNAPRSPSLPLRGSPLVLACLLSGLLLPPPAPADAPARPASRHELFFAYNATSWAESQSGGEQVLEEEGYTLGLHLRSQWRAGREPDVRSEIRGFTGTLDYDGMTFGGAPLQTTTDYAGLGGSVDAGLPLRLGEQSDARLFCGLSTDGWVRSIDNTGRISGEGYNEWWFVLDAIAGVSLNLERPEGWSWFLEPGIAYPLYQRVAYDLKFPDGTDDISVEPGREPEFRVEAGVRSERWLLSLLYRARTFAESDHVRVGPFTVSQPESDLESLAFRFGIRF